MNFDSDVHKAWIYKLSCLFSEANRLIEKRLGIHQSLKEVNFNLSEMNHYRGLWIPETRTIQLSLKLLRDYEWKAVEYVLRHEMAHAVVSEIFNFSLPGVSHGEAFKKACDVLDIDSQRCSSHDYLSLFKGTGESTLVDKVRKLLLKGNCSSISIEESNLFLSKAHEIMVSHNISMKSITGTDRWFVTRPVGGISKNLASYISVLRNILKNFYFVRSISTHLRVNGKSHSRIELFGEKENVDIAEYIYHALLTNAEMLWNDFCKEKKADGELIRGRYSKAAYITGVMNGYREQLENRREKNEEERGEADMTSLIYMKDPLVEEMFKKQYPRMVNITHYSGFRSGGYGTGKQDGLNLRIARGVTSRSNGGLCLASKCS